MNVSSLSVNTTKSLGAKCNGAKYTELFQKAFNGIGEAKTEGEAVAKFWANFARESVGYHTGASGKATYSAPFLTTIRAAFETSPETKAKK